MSIGANARRSRVLNLSKIVKGRRGSFTNFQFERRSEPSTNLGNLRRRLSRYFFLSGANIKYEELGLGVQRASCTCKRYIRDPECKRPRDSLSWGPAWLLLINPRSRGSVLCYTLLAFGVEFRDHGYLERSPGTRLPLGPDVTKYGPVSGSA